jgi:hypothetical protein
MPSLSAKIMHTLYGLDIWSGYTPSVRESEI